MVKGEGEEEMFNSLVLQELDLFLLDNFSGTIMYMFCFKHTHELFLLHY